MQVDIDVEKMRELLERGKDITETFEQEQNDPITIVVNAEALQGILIGALALLLKSCSVCRGSKRVWWNKTDKKVISIAEACQMPDDAVEYIPCPACGTKEISLTKGYKVLVDAEDYERVNEFKWRAIVNAGVAHTVCMSQTKGEQTHIKMHRFILNAPDGMFVDHINYNCLDNRKANLRLCTPQESSFHRRGISGRSSEYKGVCWAKREKKWEACIKHNNKKIFIGQYDDEKEAARAYDIKAKELFGKFVHLNFPACSVCKRCGGVNGKHKQVDDPMAGDSHMLTKMQCPFDESCPEPLICKRCGKTFPAFMQEEYRGHEDNCRTTPTCSGDKLHTCGDLSKTCTLLEKANQVPAGEVEELVKELRNRIKNPNSYIDHWHSKRDELTLQVLDHLTAQAKQIERQVNIIKDLDADIAKGYSEAIDNMLLPLQAKIKQLEAENKRLTTLEKMCQAIVVYNKNRHSDSEQFRIRRDMFLKIRQALKGE
ncbi:hypothetical protein LCGC14_0421170 [marine sediment metagenome]|uniref:AP2/ERF domain-containing protein n=1 Tax=marine sediment metagenome TaxID=412755 RepID=A0A0F9SQT0_9ZZZZ